MRALTFNRLVHCVSDSYTYVSIPDQMLPFPRERNKSMDLVDSCRQMRGSVYERLAELAGRVCYDSLGHGRSSEDFHRHINDVGHFSIYEHCTRRIHIQEVSNHLSPNKLFKEMLFFHNKPNLRIFVTESPTGAISVEVVFNLRHAIEYCLGTGPFSDGVRSQIFSTVLTYDTETVSRIPAIVSGKSRLRSERIQAVVFESNPFWISFYFRGSRAFSHELVRHGDFTAVSQRSTRYVDESDSIDCWHPLMRNVSDETFSAVLKHADQSRVLYGTLTKELEELGLDRKQYRGAARGVLPTALSTELIFSGSVLSPDQWGHISKMRCDPTADEEINELISNTAT